MRLARSSWWSFKYLFYIDLKVLFATFALMGISLLVVSSQAEDSSSVVKQLQFFGLSFLVFLFFAGFDYHKLREWAWIGYALVLLALLGLFFTDSIARVHRWYRIPFIGLSFQPSEYAKLMVVIALAWFLERRIKRVDEWSTALLSFIIVGVPFILILKQPDLGSALVLYPMTLVIFYLANIKPVVVKALLIGGALLLVIVALFFLEVVSHEKMRDVSLKFIKEYQYERLKPNQHHQKAAATAIALGGITGTGWKKSDFSGGGWLPAPYTDSVFAAFGEEFGLIGLFILIALYWALLYFSFQVAASTKDAFGRLLAGGIAVYLAMHAIVNIGMMCGFLPITGVPLLLVTYGGSSIISTMMALGILQSIHCRRFTF